MSVQLWNTKLLKLIQIFHEYCIKKKKTHTKTKALRERSSQRRARVILKLSCFMTFLLPHANVSLLTIQNAYAWPLNYDLHAWRMLLSFLPLWLEQNWMTSLVLQAVKTWDSKIYSCSLHNVLLSFDSWLLFGKG